MTIQEELETIRRKNPKGMLLAEDVVKFAKNPKTALHGRFTWDDGTAAYQYRLWQARMIIRVSVTVLPKAERQTRAYVSLMNDRQEEGGGYRTMIDVLSDADQRASLLQEALDELNRLRDRYKELKELAPIFEALDKVEAKRSKRTNRRQLETASAGS